MKLSLSWIFDHIDGDWKKQDIDYLVSTFNKKVAEIEHYYKVEWDLKDFALCKVLEQTKDGFKVSISEWKKEAILPSRDDSRSFLSFNPKNLFYMVYRSGDQIKWATLNDFSLDKDGLYPPLDVVSDDLNGNWKKGFEAQDIILEIDNKTITHRPDMWGHRGFAREIAAILDLPFLPREKFLGEMPVFTYDKKANTTETNPISIEIKSDNCKRFAGLYFDLIQQRPSCPFITSRLIKVGVRPINGIVDLTNYLTLDWSQPVHAYDSTKIEGNKIIARMAKNGEKITMIDGEKLELTDKDLVIADAKKPLCLAGVMGGIDSGIGPETKSMFFESANFDAACIRRTSMCYGYRTESSMRFEKSLDLNQNIEGILRFLKLAAILGIKFKTAQEILSVGPAAEPLVLNISHEYFETRSGLPLKEYDIDIPLERLGFKVEKELEQGEHLASPRSFVYTITVPTFRSSKDIEFKEDILEEIIRYYGFDKIEPELPKIVKQPSDLTRVFRTRKSKDFLVQAAKMTEQQNYVFYDEQFLALLGLQDQEVAGQLINPVSENNKRLISSLLPGLFKNIKDNFQVQDSLNFFELGRIWASGKKDQILEQKSLAGIFFEKRKNVDFYDCKNFLTDLLDLIGIKKEHLEWKRVDESVQPWARPYQTAELFIDSKNVGMVGKVDKAFLNKLDVLPESDAFFFELNADYLLNYAVPVTKFKPLQKYQGTFLDFSLFVPLTLTTEKLEKTLLTVDDLITDVKLIDFFEKEEWPDKRSLTFRLSLNNPEKTLEKDEIDSVWQKAIKSVEQLGVKLRG